MKQNIQRGVRKLSHEPHLKQEKKDSPRILKKDCFSQKLKDKQM